MTTQSSTQQPTPQQTQVQVEQALQQHAVARGLNLSGMNWGALVDLIMQFIQTITQGQQPQPAGQQRSASANKP